MALITFPNKSTGDSFTAVEATEIKTIVNANSLAVDSDFLIAAIKISDYGSNNMFVGKDAGNASISTGLENVMVGTNSGKVIDTSNRNTSVGYNSMPSQVSGYNNSAFGNTALYSCVSGSSNVAIGKGALYTNIVGHSNVAVGTSALLNTTSTGSVAVGTSALKNNTAGNNTAIGGNAGLYVTTGNRITAIGFNTFAGSTNTAPTDSVAIGYNALFSAIGTRNIGIGTEVFSVATGSQNIGIGCNVGDFYGAGDNIVIIGDNAATGSSSIPTSGNDVVIVGGGSGYYNQGQKNIVIGGSSNPLAAGVITGENKILIGSGLTDQSTSDSNTLNIQNIIFGANNTGTGTTISTGNIGIAVSSPTARLHLPAGESGANKAPLKLTSGVVMTTIENGSLEYDGTNLYFTTGGVRKTVTLA